MLNRDGLFAKRDIRSDEALRKESAQAVPTTPINPVHNTATTRTSPGSDSLRSHPVAAAAESRSLGGQEGSKLIVGPNIQLKGVEISNCDVLSVEGHVEATVSSRALHIAQPGTFNGQADIEVAEIQGHFTGELTVRKKLVVQATGKVSGKIRYGKLVVEEGGEVSGDVKTTSADGDMSVASASPPPLPKANPLPH